MNKLRKRLVYAMLHEKFGATACRVFRLLVDKHLLEQKQVCSLFHTAPPFGAHARERALNETGERERDVSRWPTWR